MFFFHLLQSLNRDIFSHFTALKKLTLPSGAADLVEDLCTSMQKTLVTVCTESCNAKPFECPDAPQEMEDDLLSFILPGTIALSSIFDENTDPVALNRANVDADKVEGTQTPEEELPEKAPESSTGSEFSMRSAVNKAPEGISPSSTLVEPPKQDETSNDQKEPEVVGATTSAKTGGVDKSVIGIVVAGMVLVVAGVTIKKNWSSIRKRFSSAPRAANEHAGANANGSAPEEVPLQEKSPV